MPTLIDALTTLCLELEQKAKSCEKLAGLAETRCVAQLYRAEAKLYRDHAAELRNEVRRAGGAIG